MVINEAKAKKAAVLFLIGAAVSLLTRNAWWVMHDAEAWQRLNRFGEAAALVMYGCAANLFLMQSRSRFVRCVIQCFISIAVSNAFCRLFSIPERFNPAEYLFAIGLIIFHIVQSKRENR